MSKSSLPGYAQLKKWRDDTPGCSHRIHLNNAGAALMPKPVIDAISCHLELESQIGGYEAADATSGAIADAYSAVSNLIGSKPSNIAMVENATVATSQALSSFKFQRGDRVITTNVDYSSNQIMLLSLAHRFGIEILRADDLPEGGVDPESIRKLIRKHRPVLVLMSWIPTNSGLIQDTVAVGEICRKEEVPFLLDACQAVGQVPVNIEELNCDFLACTSRKFLRGPRGMGFLYVSDRMLERNATPIFPDSHGSTWTEANSYNLHPGAQRFENWEFPYALLLGMGAAAEYALEVGDISGKRALALAEYTRDKLIEVPGAEIQDRGHKKCAIVSVTFEGRDPDFLMQELRKQKINTSSVSRSAGIIDMEAKNTESVLRISPHYYNSVEEIDELVTVLETINVFNP